MIVIEINEGEKINYSIEANKITFDDELTLNLEKHERDDPAHIDICRDKYGCLVTGVIPGLAENYVAQIDIPAREYDYSDEENPVAMPFDMERCTLTLWALN